jgi:hypothetical protein
MTPVSDSSVDEFMARVGAVARLFPLSPPLDAAAHAKSREIQLKLIFGSTERLSSVFSMMADFSHMKDIAKAARDELIEYLTQGHNSLSGGLVTRMFALRNFKDEVIDPSINLCWNYLILHQVIFERVAKQHPQLCGYQGWESEQTIAEYVNNDLMRLCIIASGTELDVAELDDVQRSTIKVPADHFWSSHFIEVLCLFL